MASFGAIELKEGNFMAAFKVQGQVYCRIVNLMARPKQPRSFLQIYFFGDSDNEKDIHFGINPCIKPELVIQLQHLLRDHSQFILYFKAAIHYICKGQKVC